MFFLFSRLVLLQTERYTYQKKASNPPYRLVPKFCISAENTRSYKEKSVSVGPKKKDRQNGTSLDCADIQYVHSQLSYTNRSSASGGYIFQHWIEDSFCFFGATTL